MRINYHNMFNINIWSTGVNVDNFSTRTDNILSDTEYYCITNLVFHFVI